MAIRHVKGPYEAYETMVGVYAVGNACERVADHMTKANAEFVARAMNACRKVRLFAITLDRKPATLAEIFRNEGWEYDYLNVSTPGTAEPDAYIVARTAAACRGSYEQITGIAWTQKRPNVRCERVSC